LLLIPKHIRTWKAGAAAQPTPVPRQRKRADAHPGNRSECEVINLSALEILGSRATSHIAGCNRYFHEIILCRGRRSLPVQQDFNRDITQFAPIF